MISSPNRLRSNSLAESYALATLRLSFCNYFTKIWIVSLAARSTLDLRPLGLSVTTCMGIIKKLAEPPQARCSRKEEYFSRPPSQGAIAYSTSHFSHETHAKTQKKKSLTPYMGDRDAWPLLPIDTSPAKKKGEGRARVASQLLGLHVALLLSSHHQNQISTIFCSFTCTPFPFFCPFSPSS